MPTVQLNGKIASFIISKKVAFLGGAAVGAAVGILFAPEKGEDTRHKIAEILRKKGIRLNRSEMENLVDEIAAEIKGEGAE